MNKSTTKTGIKALAVHGLLIAVSLPIVLMFAWLLKESLYNATTKEFTFANWRFLYESAKYSYVTVPAIWPVLGFTVLFGAIVTALDVAIATLAAYAVSRLDFRGKSLLLKGLFLLGAFPGVTIMIAVFFILTQAHLTNTLAGVVLVSVAGMLPGHVYMLKGFFDDVPWDFEWSALVDGCSRWSSFVQVVLPAVKPGISAIAVFAFMNAYGEWFLFKILLFQDRYSTLARLLSYLVSDEQKILGYGVLAALGIFYTIPIAVFYVLTENRLMRLNNLGGRKFV